MFERFTERARQIVVLAQDEARGLKHNYIGGEHLLLGMLREEEGIAARVLAALDVSADSVRDEIRRRIGEGDAVLPGQIPFTPRAKKITEYALREALSLGHNYIGTEHILLGFVRDAGGPGYNILLDQDADGEKIRNEVIRQLTAFNRFPPRRRWSRSDVALNGVWQRGSDLFLVVAIADEPTVTLEDVRTGERENHVISSPLFGEFNQLRSQEDSA